MNLGELQAELRHFAAERDWQPLQTPKNLTTALMVEAAELAEIFQWQSPEESQRAHEDATKKQHIGEEVADVLLYLLQVADHCHIDVAEAVRNKIAKNAIKYPAKHAIARASPARASVPGTQVLLDYENVQPSDAELRALGANGPTKPTALRRPLKSLLAVEAGDPWIEAMLDKLTAAGVVVINAERGVSCPLYETDAAISSDAR